MAKYRAERDKRLRADGNAQYQRLTGRFAHYADDPYTPFREREPKTDHVTFAFVGGGFAGLVTCARLVEAGITDVRIVEKGGDFGGTWYWNRYPGAQCDTASMVYMPLLEETGHRPTREIRPRAGDPRAVPAHRPPIRPLRQRPVPHRDHRPVVGRSEQRLGGADQPRRRIHRAASSAWAPARCTCPSCPAFPGSRTSRATPSTPADGTTTTPAAIRTARRWTSSPTSAWRSSARARRRCSACRTWPARPGNSTSSSARPHRSTCATTAPIDPDWFAEDRDAWLATALAGELHRQPGRRHGR